MYSQSSFKPNPSKKKYNEEMRLIKSELSNKEFVKHHKDVLDILDVLDQYFEKLDRCNDRSREYLKIQIREIVEKVEKLQGTKHVNILL